CPSRSDSKDGNPRSLPILVSWTDFESRNHIIQSSGSSLSSPLRQNISPDPSGALIVIGGRSCALAVASSAVTLGCSGRPALSARPEGDANSCCCGGAGEPAGDCASS